MKIHTTRKLDEAEEARVAALYREGLTIAELGQRFSVSSGPIHRALNTHNVTRRGHGRTGKRKATA